MTKSIENPVEPEVSSNGIVIVDDLAYAISIGDMNHINELLNENGEYVIANSKLELQKTDKYGFLNWIKPILEEKKIDFVNRLKYEFDQCMFCRIGNPVIIFDDGRFPIQTKEPRLRKKIGLMIEFEGDRISDISLCGTFLEIENPYHHENFCENQIQR